TAGGVHPGEVCSRGVSGAAILSVLGDRLLHGLPDGVRRDGGIGASRAGRRQLAGAHLARASRQVDPRSRRSAAGGARGAAARVTRRRAGALVDGQRVSIRAAAPPQASRAAVRNSAVLGAALGSARLSPPGVAVTAETG